MDKSNGIGTPVSDNINPGGGGGNQNGNGASNSDLAVIKNQLNHTATKVGVEKVRTEVVEIKSDMKHHATKADLNATRADMKSESNKILMWVIGLFVSSVAVMIAIQKGII